MKEFIYQIIDFMWFWTSNEVRVAKVVKNGAGDIFEILYWMYLLGALIPIGIGTIGRYMLGDDYRKSLPTIVINGKSITPSKEFINSLIHVQVIENVLFWLIFNTMLLALPLGLTIFIYIIALIVRGRSLTSDDAARLNITVSAKYFISKLESIGKKQVFNKVLEEQANYLTIEKQFLDDLSKYKNEGSTNLLQAGVN